jgi:predicted lipoprotein with Yx(FWY)xxD motif
VTPNSLTRPRSILVLAAGLGLALAGCGASSSGSGAAVVSPAAAGSTPAGSTQTVTIRMADDGGFGHILETASGSTLYLFTPDKPGTSVCTGACAAIWPPLTVPAGAKVAAGSGVSAGVLSTITRSDGTKQVAVNGHPVYRFAADKSAGQTKGEGVEGTWFLIAPTGTAVKHATTTAAVNSTPTPVSPPTSAPASTSSSTGGSGGYGY